MAPERTCVLEKGPTGYGFHLHSEKNRPGQFVRLVEPDSAAEKSGLRAGDRLIRVCGDDVRELSHQQVVNKIRGATEKLILEVEGPEDKGLETSPVCMCYSAMSDVISGCTSINSPATLYLSP